MLEFSSVIQVRMNGLHYLSGADYSKPAIQFSISRNLKLFLELIFLNTL